MIDVTPMSERVSATSAGGAESLTEREKSALDRAATLETQIAALKEQLAEQAKQLREALDMLHEVTEGKPADAH